MSQPNNTTKVYDETTTNATGPTAGPREPVTTSSSTAPAKPKNNMIIMIAVAVVVLLLILWLLA